MSPKNPFRMKYWNRRRFLTFAILLLFLSPMLWVSAKIIKTRYSQNWVPTYVGDVLKGRYTEAEKTQDMVFLLCDHWEPGKGESALRTARAWLDTFESVASRHTDSNGRHFQYSWFYPIDNFDERIIERLARSASAGFGEIEVHWHHHHSDRESYQNELSRALVRFTKVGALVPAPDAQPRFVFIHGNWTLDNSGNPRFCGIDSEIDVLMENGCYADMTFPALGTSAQPSHINRIFYTLDTPEPKSYEINPMDSQVGRNGKGLLLLQGPLGFNWRNPLILIESGALDDSEGTGLNGRIRKPNSNADYFKPQRVHLWNNLGGRVVGREDVVFIKIHAHGVQQREVLLGGELEAMLAALETYCQKRKIRLHYVTAREAYNLVRALEADSRGDLTDYYDLVIPAPMTRQEGFPPSSNLPRSGAGS